MEVRTSITHPIRIGWVDAPPPCCLGITIAPGKNAEARDGFRWERDLQVDLAAIRSAPGHYLVCLLELDEMDRLGIPTLFETAKSLGLEPIHLPIRDVSIPTLQEARALVRRLLQVRGPIMVHCAGGLGRSGVIAGVLLRALGVPYEDVLQRLRTARGPECPQTSEQRAFIQRFQLD